jgi:2'-5' RNA ligase
MHPALSRFFIALVPPVEIQDYAQQVIQKLSDRYHTHMAKAPPHITLQPPFQISAMDTLRLEQQLEMFAIHQSPFSVTLSGFGAFAPRVLYLNVLKTSPLLTIQSRLMAELETTLGIVDLMSKQRPFAPHLTIASRNMTRQIFDAAWAALNLQQANFEFVGDALTLLIHDGECWQVHSQFPLIGNELDT